MTEDEAEAALLALGEVLTWKANPPLATGRRAMCAYALPTGRLVQYFVQLNRSSADYWQTYGVNPNNCRWVCICIPLYVGATRQHFGAMNIRDAKAACQRHYATGVWEG